jgi:hypothetical protein
MPNYINTSALTDGQQADAADVKTPLETLDQVVYDIANGTTAITPDIDGNLLLDGAGTSDASPREMGVTGMGSGNRMRLHLGDDDTGIQNGTGRMLDIYSGNSIRLIGSRGDAGLMGYEQFNDSSVIITGHRKDKIILIVKGDVNQNGDLQQWMDSDDNILVYIDKDGELNTLKQTLHVVAAPTSGPADAVQLWAEDVSGSAELKVRDEAGNVTTLSSHNPQIVETDGRVTSYVHQEYNPYSGKRVEMDVYGALERLETLTGERFIHVDALPQSMRETWDEIEKVPAVKDALEWEDTREHEAIILRQQAEISELKQRLARIESLIGNPVY